MKYPLSTYQDFLQEIKRYEDLIVEYKDDERTVKYSKERIEIGKEIISERFNQLKLF